MCSNDLFIFLHYVFHMKYYFSVITCAPKADKRGYTYAMPHDLPLISMYMNRYEFSFIKYGTYASYLYLQCMQFTSPSPAMMLQIEKKHKWKAPQAMMTPSRTRWLILRQITLTS